MTRTIGPGGKSGMVPRLEAGVVRAFRVTDGDHVTADPIVSDLDQTVGTADRDRLGTDWREARLDVAGLRALSTGLSGASFDPAHFVAPDGIPPAEVAVARASIEARARKPAQKCQSLEQQIAQKTAEAAENQAMVGQLAASLPILLLKRDVYRSPLNVAFTNKIAWLDTDQLLRFAAQQAHGAEILAANVAQLDQTRAGYAHDVLKDLAEAEQKARELAQHYAGAVHKATETALTAPIHGTVQALAVHTAGVVTPAQALLTVVPDDGPVLVEATVDNGDIGFVQAGQDVDVKVRTFEFTRYGLLHGHVVYVSRDRVAEASPAKADGKKDADPTEDGKPNEPGYVAHVALDSTRMVVDGREEALSPGMAVTAEIKTGRRSVMSYLLSPLQRYAQEGWRER